MLGMCVLVILRKTVFLIKVKLLSSKLFDLDIALLILGVILEHLPLRLLALYLLYDPIIRRRQRLMRLVRAHRLDDRRRLRSLLLLRLQRLLVLLILELGHRVEQLHDL